MKRFSFVWTVGAGMLLLALPSSAEDLTIAFKTTGPGGEGTSTQYYSSERMRTSDGRTDMIFEYATGKMISVDHQKKQYSEMTLAEMEAAMKGASAQMEKMGAEMENMPAAMRERMQKMMGGGGEVTLTRGGQREIAGYATQEYVIKAGDSEIHTWTTTGLHPPVSLENLRRISSLAGPMAAMASNPMLKGMSEMAEKMREVEGFPLASSNRISVMGRAVESSQEATRIDAGAIPPETFDLGAIAPGYKKVDSPLAKAGKR